MNIYFAFSWRLTIFEGLMLFGESNPLLNILKSGSTSVFLMLSKFFQAVESLLGKVDQRIFRNEKGYQFNPCVSGEESAHRQLLDIFLLGLFNNILS